MLLKTEEITGVVFGGISWSEKETK